MLLGLCFVRFMEHFGACSTKCSSDVFPDALCLAYYDCPLCVCTVSVTYLDIRFGSVRPTGLIKSCYCY